MEKVYIVISDFRYEKIDAIQKRIEKVCKDKEKAEECLAKLAEKAKSYALENFDIDELEIEDGTADSFSIYKNYEYDSYHEDIWIVEKPLV